MVSIVVKCGGVVLRVVVCGVVLVVSCVVLVVCLCVACFSFLFLQQARQLTPQRGTVAQLGNRGCCVHIHTASLSKKVNPRSTRTPESASFIVLSVENVFTYSCGETTRI